MDRADGLRHALTTVTNQPKRNKNADPLAKIRPLMSRKPSLVQPLSNPNPISATSGFKLPNTRIQAADAHSYEPLVTISDNDHSDEEDFTAPIQILTKEELCEELRAFKSTQHAPLVDDDDLESLVDVIKREQGHFDGECISFLDLSSRNLSDVNSLAVCRNLIILKLNNNQLTNVRAFGVFTQLKILSLAENQLTSLDGLQSCESLETLNVAGNNLSGLKSLAPLLQLAQLRSLCLFDQQNNLSNPLCSSASYQQDVKNNLPNLDILDNEWLGQGFRERLCALEASVEQLENPGGHLRANPREKPTILITKTTSSDRSIQSANDEYEQLLQSIRMLVK